MMLETGTRIETSCFPPVTNHLIHLIKPIWVWVKLEYPNNWMPNIKPRLNMA